MDKILHKSLARSNDDGAWHDIELVEFNHTFNELSVSAALRHKITINLTADRYVVAKIGDDWHEKHIERGGITLVPATQPSNWHNLTYPESKILQLYLQPAFLGEVALSAEVNPGQVELVSQLGVRDLQIEHIALALRAELAAGCPSGRLYGESAATMLSAHLLRHYCACQQIVREYKGGMPKLTVGRVLDYINDKCAENPSLDELAVVANLSRYHFVRQFKQATGFTPHRFLLNVRLEKAKNLLRNPLLSIAEIALQTGFADQSHFSRAFKNLHRCTPREFRFKA